MLALAGLGSGLWSEVEIVLNACGGEAAEETGGTRGAISDLTRSNNTPHHNTPSPSPRPLVTREVLRRERPDRTLSLTTST